MSRRQICLYVTPCHAGLRPAKGHSEEQSIAALKQYENGDKVADICRKLGVSEAGFYTWKKQSTGLGAQEPRELGQLREENGRLKRIVADLTACGAAVVNDESARMIERQKLAELPSRPFGSGTSNHVRVTTSVSVEIGWSHSPLKQSASDVSQRTPRHSSLLRPTRPPYYVSSAGSVADQSTIKARKRTIHDA